MPNEISDDFHKAEHAVEDWFHKTLEPALDAEWVIIKPQVVALGVTLLSQIWTAAKIFMTTGDYEAALASIVAQLPSDGVVAVHIIATALSGAIASLQAKQAAAA